MLCVAGRGFLDEAAALLLVHLLEKRGISSRWTDYLPLSDSRFKEELVFVLNSINNYLIAFFRGQVLVGICDGILYGIGFLLATAMLHAGGLGLGLLIGRLREGYESPVLRAAGSAIALAGIALLIG